MSVEKSRNFKPKLIELISSKILVVLGIYSSILFLVWLTDRSFKQDNLLYIFILIAFIYKVILFVVEWLLIWHPSVPNKPELKKKYTVDVLTTYVEGEPKEMLKESLQAIKAIKYPHETFLCDEADDPELKEFCEQHKIHHVTRENKIDAKAGNINNALQSVAKGEIVLILDPDHKVYPNFLDEVLPFFEDEQIGFVQVVQAYKNQDETIIAKAAADQTYQFYGPAMMTLNSYGATPAIGANCTFRRAALDSIGGHAPGLTEDMHTTLKLKAKGWKSVYNPVIVAKGLVPWNYSGYCLQQLKWSRGTFDLLYNVFPKVVKKLSWPQRLTFLAVPLFYLSGFVALIDFFIPSIALIFNIVPINLGVFEFVMYFSLLYLISQIIRFYHQKWYYEEREKGTAILGGILFKASWWATLLGFIYSLINKKVPYIPTPKDFQLETPWKLLIPNLIIVVVSIFAIVYGLIQDFTPFSLFMAFLAFLNIMILGFGSFMAMQKQIVLLHEMFQGSFLSKGSNTRKFIFKVKHNIYNYLTRKFAVVGTVLLMLFLNVAIFKMTPSKLPQYLTYEFIAKKTSEIIGKNYNLNIERNYGQLYVGNHLREGMKFSNLQSSFVIGNFHLNRKNELSLEQFLDSCYSNNILPYLSLSIDTTNKQSIHSTDNILTLEYLFKEVKRLYLPLVLMFERNSNDISNELYADIFDKAYTMADSMAIHLLITWVWNSDGIDNDDDFKYFNSQRRIDWIYSDKETAYLYQNKYYGKNKEEFRIPFLVDKANVKNLSRRELKKNHHVQNIVGIIGEQANISNKLEFDIKEVYKRPDNYNTKRLALPNYVKGVAYNPGHAGDNSDKLPLTVDKLTRDFRLIKDMGSNTIRRFAHSIYDYNLLKAADDFDLDILYGFWFVRDVDYYADKKKLNKRKEEVMKIVEKYQSDSSIICWGLGNETWHHMRRYYGQPYLGVVRTSYLKFLNELVDEIKLIDNKRPIYSAETQNTTCLYSFAEYVPHIDFMGVNSYYDENISQLKDVALNNLNGIPYLVSEFGNKGYWDPGYNDYDSNNRLIEQTSVQKAKDFELNWNKYILPDKGNNLGGIAFCWQDRYEYTATWFGIIDIFGNKKPAYYALKDIYTNNSHSLIKQFPIPEFILSASIDSVKKNKFYAKATTENTESINNYQYKWIIYTDNSFEKIKETYFEYGNSSISFKVPDKDDLYRIHLYVKDDLDNVITETLPINYND